MVWDIKRLQITLNKKWYQQIIDHCDEIASNNLLASTITALSLRLKIAKN
jgi:hypothetical protein